MLVILLQPDSSYCQSTYPKTEKYFNLFSDLPENNPQLRSFNDFIEKLERKADKKSDKDFLSYLFFKTHDRYLKRYETYGSFAEMIETGNYNCLTATALYSLLLNHFEFDFDVIETNYHIFLMVNTEGGKVLLETTDPIHGFFEGSEAIAERLNKYKENVPYEEREKQSYFQFSVQMFESIGLDQLNGLLLYNEAIEAFNDQQYAIAVNFLDKATKQYNSKRFEEFSKMIMYAVAQSSIDMNLKQEYVKRLQAIRKQLLPGIAASEAHGKLN